MSQNDQIASFDTEDESRFVAERRSNIKSDLIEITEDKLENILLKHLQRMGYRRSWIAPLGIGCSIIMTMITATFNDKWGVKSSSWEAIFYLSAFSVGVWLLLSLAKLAWRWRESSLEFLICQIKDSDER